MEKNTYFLKTSQTSTEEVIKEIKIEGGQVKYVSPVLPVIAFEYSKGKIHELKERFSLEYLIEAPEDGKLLNHDEEGTLASTYAPLQIVPKINHQKLRNAECVGWGITVAILDAGISEPFVKEHHDFTGYGSMPAISHGNAVGSIVNRIARGSRIVSCKITQSNDNVRSTDVLKGIDHAVNVVKADIINLSLGFKVKTCKEGYCPLCETVNAYSQKNNVLFVTAAGNDGEKGDGTVDCPGNAQEVITVGAVTEDAKAVASYSGRGLPGEIKPNILTSGSIYYNGEYGYGTSYSTPIVTGVTAAIKSKKQFTSAELKDVIYSTAQDIQEPSHHQGFGLMDINGILEVVSDGENISKTQGQNGS